jgi:hypothetical protein
MDPALQTDICNFPRLNDGFEEESNGLRRSLHVPFEDASYLNAFCKKHNLTVYAILRTAWALTLQCYTSKDTICFGWSEGLFGNGEAKAILCQVHISASASLMALIRDMEVNLVHNIAHSEHIAAEKTNTTPSDHNFNTGMTVRNNAQMELHGLSHVCLHSFNLIMNLRCHDPLV